MAKKKMDENKQLDEISDTQPQPVVPPKGPDASVAAATLHPHSNDVADPKSKLEVMLSVLSGLEKMDDSWEDWFNNAMAQDAALTSNGGGVPDGAGKSNQDTLAMHASMAIGKAMKEDLNKIFGDEASLSEDFKTKASTLFEAAIEARMILEREKLSEDRLALTEEYEKKLTEEVEKLSEEVTSAVGDYLDYASQEWLKENEVAVESALRNEIASDLLEGLRNLFIENNINVPEEQVEVVDAMSEKIDELEQRLAQSISENADLKKSLEQSTKKDIVSQVSEGLTLVETEKLKELAENLDYDSVPEFKTKLETIKNSQFVKTPAKSMITEDLEEVDPNNEPQIEKTYSDPAMKAYAEAIAKQIRRKTGNYEVK